MATRLLVALAVVVLTGCSGSQATVPPDPIPSLAARFEAHLNEYLDPAWLSPPNEAQTGCLADLGGAHRACGLEGSINGSVVIVEADKRQIAPRVPGGAGPPRQGARAGQPQEGRGSAHLAGHHASGGRHGCTSLVHHNRSRNVPVVSSPGGVNTRNGVRRPAPWDLQGNRSRARPAAGSAEQRTR